MLYSKWRLDLNFLFHQAIRQRAKKQRVAKKTSAAIGSALSSGTAAVVIENMAQTQRLTEALQDDRPTNTASGSNDEVDDEEDK